MNNLNNQIRITTDLKMQPIKFKITSPILFGIFFLLPKSNIVING
jgi:hypothetical protein